MARKRCEYVFHWRGLRPAKSDVGSGGPGIGWVEHITEPLPRITPQIRFRSFQDYLDTQERFLDGGRWTAPRYKAPRQPRQRDLGKMLNGLSNEQLQAIALRLAGAL